VKRGNLTDKKISLIRSVTAEYELFKYRTLSASRQEIFDRCNEIRFYCCVWEYFQYAEDIKEEYVYACLKLRGHVIAVLYQLYLDTESLSYERWDDIIELLDALVNDQTKYGLPDISRSQNLKVLTMPGA
jgi:hypothetical protein